MKFFMARYSSCFIFASVVFSFNLNIEKFPTKNQLKYFKPNSYSENSVNYYSLIHFGEYALLGLIKSVKVWHFWTISIGWEIIELFTPYEWARESWLNKLLDMGFNFSGFFIVRKYFKNGVIL